MSHKEIAQRSTRGSFALFVGTLLSALISAVTVIVIARLLGPSEYGAYTLVVLVPNILLNFLGLGVNSGITRYAAYHLARNEPRGREEDDDQRPRVPCDLRRTCCSAICYLGAGPFSTFVLHRPELVGLVQLASLLLLAQALFSSAISALLGWSYTGHMSVSYVLQSSLRIVLVVGLVAAGFGVAGAIDGFSVSLTVASIAAVAVLLTRMKSSSGGEDGARTTEGVTALAGPPSSLFVSDVRTMLGFGWALFVGQFALSLSAQYVVALLAAISTNTYVGFYQSAVNVTVAITLSSSAISQALVPGLRPS